MGAEIFEATDGVARELVTRAVTQVGGAEAAAESLQEKVLSYYDLTSQVAQFGLLPLGFSLLILHEQYQSATNNAPFRVGYVFVRFLIIVGLLLNYDLVVTLLTAVGSGEWGKAEDFFGWIKRVQPVLMSHYDDVWDLPYFLFWTALFLIMIVCATIAYIVNTLLSISQGMLIVIILAVGKTCIAVSIVPGVGLGKSWARLLAMVAAWSGIASIIIGLMKARAGGSALGVWSAGGGDIVGILKLSAEYLVLAGFLGAVPWITAALFNGVAAMAPGVAGPLGNAIGGGKMVFQQSRNAGGSAIQGIRRRLPGGGGGSGGPQTQTALRPGKAPRASLGGSADHVDFGSRHLSGKAARDHSRASRAKVRGGAASPRAAAAIPAGRPGNARWASSPVIANRQRIRQKARATAHPRDLPAPPKPSAALSRRAAQHRATLKAAYPDLSFEPQKLSRLERGIVSELDSRAGRFGGWTHGRQGTGDFREARELAQRRVEATRAPEPYHAPPHAASSSSVVADDSDRVYASAGPVPVGDVVRRNTDGSTPDPNDLVPDELHRAEAPAGMEGDRNACVEYWSWKEGGDDRVANRRARDGRDAWSESREKELPRTVAEDQWKQFGRANSVGRRPPAPSPSEPLRPDAAAPLPRAQAHTTRPASGRRESKPAREPKKGPTA